VQRHFRPADAGGIILRGNILWVDQHFDAARSAFRQALSLRPNDEDGLRGQALTDILCAEDLVARAEESKVAILSSKTVDRDQYDTRIPRVIHLIWLGTKPMPSCVSSWTEHYAVRHPEWRVKVWRDEDIERIKLQNQAQFEAAEYFAGKADIARLEILEQEGGVYIVRLVNYFVHN
jgi:mannosyltransferase OCH1-like enzyme